MAVDDIFAASDVTSCPVLLGWRLRPLSLWHTWALRSIDCPFLSGADYNAESVAKAVMVCGLTRAEFAAQSDHDRAVLFGSIAAQYLMLQPDERDATVQTLVDYIDACSILPDFYQGKDHDPVRDRLRCPGEWHLVATLLEMRVCGSEDEAWDYPTARAHCWATVNAEKQGSQNYVDSVDRETIARLHEEPANG